MMRNIFMLSMFSISSVFSTIKEISCFNELPAHVSADTVLLLDIDETLIVTSQMLGDYAWFEYRLKTQQTNGMSPTLALEKTLAEWQTIRLLSQVMLVEPMIPQIIAQIQEKGISIMGLTSQGLFLAMHTVSQLLELCVDFSPTAFLKEECCFPMQGHTVLHRQGILFTSGKSKAESFFHLCEKTGNKPKRLVAIDDMLSHLQSLEKEAVKRGIEFIGLRYGFCDARKVAFSPEIADYQLTHSTLTHLVSDKEAREKIELASSLR